MVRKHGKMFSITSAKEMQIREHLISIDWEN